MTKKRDKAVEATGEVTVEASGRPKATIDWDKVDELLKAHCDGRAIAGILGIHPNTLYNNVKAKYGCDFSEYSQQKKGEGIAAVEEAIYQDAIKKGGVDRIFWLKNKAGWRDKQEVEHSGQVNHEGFTIIIEDAKRNPDAPEAG